MIRLLVIASPELSALEMLREGADGVELTVGADAGSLRKAARRADAVLVAPRHGPVLTGLWDELVAIRWIHALSAGVEFLPFDRLRRRSVVVTNSRGLYADALGEFAIAAMLWFAKDLQRMARNKEARRWEPYTVQRLENRTVGIIGYGGIGRAVAQRASAFGMNVLPVRRTQSAGQTIDDVLPQADYVVLSTPLTPATFRLITRERLAAMRESAVLINLGRGATVDEAALVDALQQKRIRGAALDVFETEPLPRVHPLWRLDNVLISPHTADHTDDAHVRAMQFFMENLRRFQRNEPLENVVDTTEQY